MVVLVKGHTSTGRESCTRMDADGSLAEMEHQEEDEAVAGLWRRAARAAA